MEIKTMVIILSLCMVMSIPDMAVVSNETKTETTTGKGGVEAISAYRYIDSEADTIDTDPDNTETRMELMEEPVKILFAAFEGGSRMAASHRELLKTHRKVQEKQI